MKKERAVEPSSTEDYTIFHALFEAMKDKDKERDKSLLCKLRLRK